MKKTIGIIYGGKSSEHEVSIRSAYCIMKALNYSKMNVIPLYITLKGEWMKGEALTKAPSSEKNLRLLSSLPFDIFHLSKEVDVVFPVVHGPYGEDGTLQGMLEMLAIPYVGCGVLGSSTGMDKAMMKRLFTSAGIPQCAYELSNRKELSENKDGVLDRIETTLPNYPLFVKPANMGSSIGISKVRNREELSCALELANQFDSSFVIEAFVDGRELEVGILGNEELRTSEVGEVNTTADFYDYEAKYKNQAVTSIQIPAEIPASVKERIEEMAKMAFQVLGGSGLSRADFFWDETNDQVMINEINTMPGFTPVSMYPSLFQAAGVPYEELIEALITLGEERSDEKKKNQLVAIKLND